MKDLTLTVKGDWLFASELFAGGLCRICGEEIYGEGFRMVLSLTIGDALLPRFSNTKFIFCQSCKNVIDDSRL